MPFRMLNQGSSFMVDGGALESDVEQSCFHELYVVHESGNIDKVAKKAFGTFVFMCRNVE